MERYFDLDQQTYDWCARMFDQVKRVLGMRIKMHHAASQISEGSIFLFNHFSRVETFIPQYLIYKETGEFCRSIAAAEFFSGNDKIAEVLRDLGVVPNDHPNLMELLATDILRGRKIVIFPEGGMVKDRKVINKQGGYSVFSRSANERRKHHTGAARLAIGLQIFKLAVLFRARIDDQGKLEAWAEQLGLSGVEELLETAARPISLVPASITFYPLRVDDNILHRCAELLPGDLSIRTIEELIVEGNILLKPTDMDINLGHNIVVKDQSSWIHRSLFKVFARNLPDLHSIFDPDYLRKRLLRRTATNGIRLAITRLRDRYMQDIYQTVTVNLSHLASKILLRLAEEGLTVIKESRFREHLYLAVKRLQAHREIRLHRDLCDPGRYQDILETAPTVLGQFLESAQNAGLIMRTHSSLILKRKLIEEHHFDEIRLENPIEVYANEVGPLSAVEAVIHAVVTKAGAPSQREMGHELFDDELKALEWDKALYSKPKHFEINSRETATADPAPFLHVPNNPKTVGVVLVHGFLASPAELRDFGQQLYKLGYITCGVRLKGHGTSPWDLRDRAWDDWMTTVDKGRRIIEAFVGRYVIVGFSTGASLGLVAAAERPARLAGTVVVCPPVKFRNKNMKFVPFLHGANRIIRWLSTYEGVMPFRPNESEHPLINYRNMPLRGLYELTRLTNHLDSVLGNINSPVCIIQADRDKVVDPHGATIIYEKIKSQVKKLHWIESGRHGVLNEDIGDTRTLITTFLEQIEDSLDAS